MNWRICIGLSFFSMAIVTASAGWRVYTYIRYTDMGMWFVDLSWLTNTFSVFGGIIGTLIPFIVLIKLHGYLSKMEMTTPASVVEKPIEKPKAKEWPKQERPSILEPKKEKMWPPQDNPKPSGNMLSYRASLNTNEVKPIKPEVLPAKVKRMAPAARPPIPAARLARRPPPASVTQQVVINNHRSGCITCFLWVIGIAAALFIFNWVFALSLFSMFV